MENAIQTFPGPVVSYVDRNHANAFIDGTVFRPFNFFVQGVGAVPTGGIVSTVTGSYNETLTINRAMTLIAPVGRVTIGAP